MTKLVFKQLTQENEIDIALDRIEHYSNVRLPSEYVRRCNITGGFYNGQLASIYMLVTEPAFRSISFIPDEIKKTNPFFNEDQYNMVEINGLWISPSLKTPMLQVSVWGHLIKDIFLCKKKHVLLMRNSKTKSMERFLNMVNPEILYEGEPNQMSGQKTHQMIEVSHSTRWSIILNTPKYIQEFYQRKRRSALHEKQQLVKISRA